ncbi:Gfo/Idh/MocA family oxidoreductase [Flavobacteriales bacterium]|nr:Gfo/Idh/MocA family oxidoreductase [Flavobacteriales bacterium]
MNIAIVGLGYWGPNLLRNFNSLENCDVKYVVDKRDDQFPKFKALYENVNFITEIDSVLEDQSVEAVVIATPVFTHFPIAKRALLSGKNVLIEKPITSTTEEADELIKIAKEKNLVLMVDHTFLYTGAVMKIKSLVESGELGELKYFDSTRINLGLFQADVNVLWDLAPHDISILNFIFKEEPYSVQATGASHTDNGLENIAYLTVNYKSGMIAHFNCSWTSPVKVRQTLIGGDKKMALYNDMEPSEKIKIYDFGYEVKTNEEKNRIIADYRTGDVLVPKLDSTEALLGVAKDFISSIESGDKPKSDCYLGREVVRILEASQESLKKRGEEIIL